MTDLDHLAHLAVEAAALGAVLRAAPASTPVPACPGWTLGDLARHVGVLHRWVAATVETGEKTPWRRPRSATTRSPTGSTTAPRRC